MRDRVARRFEPLSDLMIEEYLCGDLPLHENRAVEAAAEANAELDAYLRERRAEKAAFSLQRPRLAPSARVQHPGRSRWLPWAFASAVAAAVVLLAVPWLLPDEPTVRTMGGLKAELTVRRDGRTFAWGRDVLLRSGDRVRLTVESPTPGFLTVVGRDRAGVSVLYDGVPVRAGTVTAPGSLILDESRGDEMWWVLLTDRPLAPSDAVRVVAGELQGAAVAVLHLRREALP